MVAAAVLIGLMAVVVVIVALFGAVAQTLTFPVTRSLVNDGEFGLSMFGWFLIPGAFAALVSMLAMVARRPLKTLRKKVVSAMFGPASLVILATGVAVWWWAAVGFDLYLWPVFGPFLLIVLVSAAVSSLGFLGALVVAQFVAHTWPTSADHD